MFPQVRVVQVGSPSSATSRDGYARVEWDRVPGVGLYRVYVASVAEPGLGDFRLVGTSSSNAMTVTGLAPGPISIGVSTQAPAMVELQAEVKLGQWNLRYSGASDETWTASDVSTTPGKPDGGARRWSVRKVLMAQTILDAGLDIVTVQESDFLNSPRYQAGELAAQLQAISTTQVWKVLHFGSRNAIVYNSAVWVWDSTLGGKDPGLWPERELVWGCFQAASGARVVVASDHWHPDNQVLRLRQAEATHIRLAGVKARYGIPVILGVDTNDYGVSEGEAVDAMVGEGFTDLRVAYPDVTGEDWATWHNWRPMMDGTAPGQADGEWLDRIVLSEGVAPTAGGIWDTTLPLTSALASDHHLLTMTAIVTETRMQDVVPTSGIATTILQVSQTVYRPNDPYGWIATHTGLPSIFTKHSGPVYAGQRLLINAPRGGAAVSDPLALPGVPVTYRQGDWTVTLTRPAGRAWEALLTDADGRGLSGIIHEADGNGLDWDPGAAIMNDAVPQWGRRHKGRTGSSTFVLEPEMAPVFWDLVRKRSIFIIGPARPIPGVVTLPVIITGVGSKRIGAAGEIRQSVAWTEAPARMLHELHGPIVTWAEYAAASDDKLTNESAYEIYKRIAGMPYYEVTWGQYIAASDGKLTNESYLDIRRRVGGAP